MKINKILTFLLFGLILVILIELGIIFIGGSSSVQVSFPPTINPDQTSNLQSSTQNPTLPPKPFNASNIITAKTLNNEEVKYIFGLVIQEPNRNILVFEDKDGKDYTGKITKKTAYFKNIKVRTSTNGEFSYDEPVKPFNLKKGEVYLLMFDMLQTESKDIIIIDKIIKR